MLCLTVVQGLYESLESGTVFNISNVLKFKHFQHKLVFDQHIKMIPLLLGLLTSGVEINKTTC